jgi:hypothetical protein
MLNYPNTKTCFFGHARFWVSTMTRTGQSLWGRRRVLLLVFLSTWAGSGCGKDESPLLPVVGQVLLDGRPLTTGTVSFRPDPSRGNASLHHPTGVIDAAGNYRLFTARKEGAPPGWYKVLVMADKNQTVGKEIHPRRPAWLVNVKYTQVETTTVVVEVVKQPPPAAYDLQLTK